MYQKKISVCIIVGDNSEKMLNYCLSTLIEYTSVKLDIHVYNIDGHSSKMLLYLDELKSRRVKITYHVNCSTISEARNEFTFGIISGEYKQCGSYLCFLPVSYIVPKGWDVALISEHNSNKSAGVISIRTGTENLELFPRLYDAPELTFTEPKFKMVWGDKYNFIRGLQFISKQKIKKLPLLSFGYDYNVWGFDDFEFCSLAQNAGLSNYYITELVGYRCPIMRHDPLIIKLTPKQINLFKNHTDEQLKNIYKHGKKFDTFPTIY